MIRDSQASITLDLIRATAAQAVCVGHAIGLFGVWKWAQPPHVPYMQNVGVLVFFLLSGFVIAFTLDSKSKDRAYGFDDYLVDRFARIYSALIPALIVIAAIDFTWTTLTGETRSTFTLRAFIGNLFMLQDVPGPLRWFVIPSFGTAGQLWTLAIEWHIYIFAGAIFFLRRSPSMMLIALLSCTVPLLYLRRVPEQDFGHACQRSG
jgi:peptidoglycan/LPS O-acetylase OafA/YrhL